MKTVEIIRDKISYQVHPYTELFGIMAILADDSELYKGAGNEYFNSNYRNKIIQWFSPFRNHKAVLLLTEYTSDYNFNYDAPCALFLELGDNINGLSDYITKERLPIPDIQIYKFRKTIHDFILESNFDEIYNS